MSDMTDISGHTARRQLLANDLAVIVTTIICAMITWVMVAPVAGVDLSVGTGGQTISVSAGSVALTAAATSIAGLLVLRLLERLSAHGLRIWLIVAIVVAVLSMLAPLGAVSTAAAGSLMALHGVVAAVLITGAYRAHRQRLDRFA
ncbi:DUF6069 family protein [Acidipropionibacterium jensenii]|uniref:DUF6069 family protein n=2 Tax=Acidipropionibacterium jensenii TaxID=1749 RepID=UPI002646FD3A|nr:DUF6069 family protein [Acidipropionibacterium jensenii]MDN5996767.1 DUF6069 family protein [Acidipropionibacterium jensenii]MDN6479666.1 DUF6069 family protein [Acidipropionibacterium jensenii]MDN6512280.1 DUF6069 family protein [Acidipropionibacterium jensenii]MDN6659073.1 DUF6069 family protein [Acidipropionibacterium jensenii]MDN6762380.1 DUF6069 family protein [Acidipropionibacterium jensenii]